MKFNWRECPHTTMLRTYADTCIQIWCRNKNETNVNCVLIIHAWVIRKTPTRAPRTRIWTTRQQRHHKIKKSWMIQKICTLIRCYPKTSIQTPMQQRRFLFSHVIIILILAGRNNMYFVLDYHTYNSLLTWIISSLL